MSRDDLTLKDESELLSLVEEYAKRLSPESTEYGEIVRCVRFDKLPAQLLINLNHETPQFLAQFKTELHDALCYRLKVVDQTSGTSYQISKDRNYYINGFVQQQYVPMQMQAQNQAPAPASQNVATGHRKSVSFSIPKEGCSNMDSTNRAAQR